MESAALNHLVVASFHQKVGNKNPA